MIHCLNLYVVAFLLVSRTYRKQIQHKALGPWHASGVTATKVWRVTFRQWISAQDVQGTLTVVYKEISFEDKNR